MKKFNILIIFVLILSLFTGVTPSQAISTVKVHYINVGQGDSILIQTGNENVLIDGGGKGKGDEVVAYLKKQKVSTLNAVVSTHPDADHIGGLAYVINTLKVKSVYAPKVGHTTQAYKDFLLAVKNKKLTIKQAKTGVEIATKANDVSLKFLAPVKTYSTSDLNDWSAVLLLKHGKKSFLFTGDAEEKSESDMLAKGLISKVDVLKVSHHGAKEATTTAFLNKAKPTYAVISVGKNGYGHPTFETIKRLNSVKANIYRTDKLGNIIFISTGSKITVKSAKIGTLVSPAPISNVPVTVKTYKNCTELNKVYKGGVALTSSATNKGGKTKYKPYVSKALYEANKTKDRDKDYIACER